MVFLWSPYGLAAVPQLVWQGKEDGRFVDVWFANEMNRLVFPWPQGDF